jgi:hypothetical protein
LVIQRISIYFDNAASAILPFASGLMNFSVLACQPYYIIKIKLVIPGRNYSCK